jgi:WD40-like Beta Propeller Repeat
VNDERLQRMLLRAGDDGRARAELQAWPVIQAAFAAERPGHAPTSRSRAVRALAFVAAVALLAAIAVSSPGAAVADWLRDHIVGKPGVKQSAPALTHLPGGGRMLVASKAGVWVVQSDGSRRLLRGYTGATWSPRGLYVGAWRRHELFAVEPNGRVHWSLARGGRIRAADWSPDGFRIAYLSGHSLRVVAGDGTGDTRLLARVAAVAPAWKPRAPHLLLFAPRPHVVELVATDARAPAWRHELTAAVRSLAWSADGRVAAAASRARVTVLDGASGRVRNVVRVPRGFRVGAVAFARSGVQLAIMLQSPTGEARAVTVDALRGTQRPRQLFAGAGRFNQVQWSPDDRWLLISWPAANQWLFVRSSRVSAIRAVSDIARQFDPAAPGARFPQIGGWCCG